MIKTLAQQIKQYKKPTFLTILFTALEVVLDIFLPICMAHIIDDGIQNSDMNCIIKYGIIMAILSILAFFCGVISGRLCAKASTGFAYNLRREIFTRIQNFSFANIDRFSTAGLITRLTTDVNQMQMAYQMIIRMCVRSPLNLLFALIMAMTINVRMSLIFVVTIIVLVISLIILIKFAMKTFRSVFGEYDNLNASIQENIRGIRVVKSFVREEHEINKFNRAIDRLYKMFVKAESIACVNAPIMLLCVYGCTLALSFFGAKSIVGGSLTTGELSSLLYYVMNIMMSLMMLSMAFVMITIAETNCERIFQIFQETPNIKNCDNPITEVKDGSVDFENVCFKYQEGSGENALTDINIHIKPGETIGIIGGTGSGKSTLVNLIPRLYDATSGTVSVGGVDVKKYDIKTLRDQVSMVLQNNVLFSGTIFENLRWGDENATDEECIEACKLACADGFIESFPDKYNTFIERGGSNVSGGQKQRICIARALLKKPKILILDDSTSAVDTATEAKIQQAFNEKISHITKIIIAQRISSVSKADRIIVLEDGRINGIGTHEELLNSNEIYKSIVEVQSEGNADFDRQEV